MDQERDQKTQKVILTSSQIYRLCEQIKDDFIGGNPRIERIEITQLENNHTSAVIIDEFKNTRKLWIGTK